MKISELEDKQGNVNIELKVIYDKMQEQERWGKRVKTLVVADIDSKQGDETALLDVYNDDIDKYSFQDKLRVVNGFAKKIRTLKGEQMIITYGFINKELVGHYEKIE